MMIHLLLWLVFPYIIDIVILTFFIIYKDNIILFIVPMHKRAEMIIFIPNTQFKLSFMFKYKETRCRSY